MGLGQVFDRSKFKLKSQQIFFFSLGFDRAVNSTILLFHEQQFLVLDTEYTEYTESSAYDWLSPFTTCVAVDSSNVAGYCFDAFVSWLVSWRGQHTSLMRHFHPALITNDCNWVLQGGTYCRITMQPLSLPIISRLLNTRVKFHNSSFCEVFFFISWRGRQSLLILTHSPIIQSWSAE